MKNSHYVPRLVLKRFSDKLCLFNVKTGEYKENIKLDNAFSEFGFYNDEVEDKLNKKIESQFGNLLANKLLLAEKSIELNREEVRLIKKFLLIFVIRSIGSEEFMQKERNYYKDLKKLASANSHIYNFSEEEINEMSKPPFEEKVIGGETSFDYWMRTLNVILETDGSPEGILNHSEKTYPAFRWSVVINNGYLAFWDSEYDHDEFVITDIGMTSENEKGWNGITRHNLKKTYFLISLYNSASSKEEKEFLSKTMAMHNDFTENFMMFPISSKRMIVEIDPFFKFRILNKNYYEMPKLDELTMLPNEDLFYPNDVKYVYPQDFSGDIKYHENDLYIYQIKRLSKKETRYCNELFFDRINTIVGFSSLSKVVGSLFAYKKDNSYPFVPRVDYTELYDLINKRYFANIDLNSIERVRK